MNTIGFILTAVGLLWTGSEIGLARVRRSRAADAKHDKSSWLVLWGIIIPCVAAGIVLGRQRVGHFGGGSWGWPIAGLVLILAGLAVRWAAILTLKRRFTVDVAIARDHALVRSGIYRFVRHPSYTGSLLSFFGLGLAFANWISLAVIFVPITAAFIYRTRIEEKALAGFFGDEYARYCASTKRFIPLIY